MGVESTSNRVKREGSWWTSSKNKKNSFIPNWPELDGNQQLQEHYKNRYYTPYGR